jgi:hypothetical protein
MAEKEHEGSSSCPTGDKSMFKELWLAKVPPKVGIFAWKLDQEGLATDSNRKRRTLTQDGTCKICGVEEETGYHAVVRCTKAGLGTTLGDETTLVPSGGALVLVHRTRLAISAS